MGLDLNAVTRSLDLACKVVSPAVAGLIIEHTSLVVSAVVIAAWNVFSLVAEYSVLSHVYRLVPALSRKQTALDGEFQSLSTIMSGHIIVCRMHCMVLDRYKIT